MKCLYCGRGIGPIRQIRDVEFCSEAHRNQFRERYRQQVYEALAPEPAPIRTADFIERPTHVVGPAPIPVLRVMGRPSPGQTNPCVTVEAAGIAVERPSWIIRQDLAAMPVRLAWRETVAARPLALQAGRPVLPDGIQAPQTGIGGELTACLAATDDRTQGPVAAPRIHETARPISHPAALPGVTRSIAPAQAKASAPQFEAAIPASAVPTAIGSVAAAAHALMGATARTAITAPAAPAGNPVAAEARPLQAGPLLTHCDLHTTLEKGYPVAFEPPGTRNIAIILPKPPAAAATDSWISAATPVSAAPRRSDMQPAATHSVPVHLPAAPEKSAGLAPLLSTADLQPAAMLAASPTRYSERIEGDGRPMAAPTAGSTMPVGVPVDLAQPQDPRLREADGNRTLRAATAAAPVPADPTTVVHELSALAGGAAANMGSAPPHRAGSPVPAMPTAAAPVWTRAMAAPQERPLVPLAGVDLPVIECLPSPAGALDTTLLVARNAARSVRACAILWTLRMTHVFAPDFRMEPVRAKFSDLLRTDHNLAYGRDTEYRPPVKSKVRPIKREPTTLALKPKLAYIGMAAAAMLAAGILRPQASSNGAGDSSLWHGGSIRQWLSARATRDFSDDFRGGLAQWKGVQAKWPKSWSYSTDGFIHPGQLALYRPSVPLSDYRFEFMAQIENKSVDWVVRAHDADNYYALKFTVVQPGPRPIVAMVRYPVIGGNRGTRVQTPLRMMIHANTPYRVTVDVKGNHYRAFVEGQEADFWTEDRLKTGGVGFFSDAGERARVYWVKLESNGDLLGRICGLLSAKGGNATDTATAKEKQAMDYRHAGLKDLKAASVSGGTENTNATQEARISRVLSKAASLHLDGKLGDAAKELARAIDGGERHPALYFALGQLQYELQEYGPASQSYSQAALLQPLHPTAHFNAGVCQGRVEHWDEAAASFRKAISNDPARTEAHLALGACLVQLGLHNEALDAYDRFLERHPDHDEALFGKAVALQKRDRSNEAVDLYRRILARNPHSEEALSNLVSLSLANQDYDQVRKYAQKLADSQPKSQIALEGLAGAAFAAGDHKAAADYSRKLAELAPQVFENWFNLGVACHKAGDLPSAADAYARATRVQADSPQAHLNLGVALQEQGDLKGARAAYQRALAIDAKLPGVHWNLGLVHEQLGESESAEKLYAQVPENSPDSDDAAFRIGHLRLQRGDYPGSIRAFEACLLKRPNWPEARLNLGIAHWRAGDKESARVCFQELTASGADSKEALRGLAALSLEHQDYDKAFEIYRQLLDAGERSPELLYNAGLICQRRGEAEDAAVLYKEAIRADPGFGEALLNLGHALMSLGNEFEARSCWRKAVIAKPELAQRYFEPAAQAS